MKPIPTNAAIPQHAGIGLRTPHLRQVLDTRPAIAWLEAHSENFFCPGARPRRLLERIRADYPLSLHGVGLSLGAIETRFFEAHLARLGELIAAVEPGLVSEHLSWGAVDTRHLNDLLPLPYTEEALDHVCARIHAAQAFLGRRLAIENISSYVRYRHETIPEWEFVAQVAQRTGCGLLLDVNNIYVSSVNHGFDPRVYLAAIATIVGDCVEEIHLAGFDEGQGCLIDTHGKPVSEPVWALYREAVDRLGPRPTLIEWDTDIPPLAVLLAERDRAQAILLEHEHALAA
jgi:uncharacterized protein (UPF0276 family)